MKTMIRALMIALFCMTVAAPGLSAQEKNFELRPAATVKDILSENIGKRVIVRINAGDNLEGTVSKAGDGLAHISKLSGRDFHDAAVRIDRISAVIFKARGN